MTTMFHVTGKACLLLCYVAFIVYTHPSLGSEREYRITERGTTQHTCNNIQSLFLAKQFLFDTVHAVSAMEKPTVNAQDPVISLSLHSCHGKLLRAIYVTDAPQVEEKGLVNLWFYVFQLASTDGL